MGFVVFLVLVGGVVYFASRHGSKHGVESARKTKEVDDK